MIPVYYYWPLVCFLLLNIASFIIYVDDKKRADRGAARYHTEAMFQLALFGGGLGAWLGMRFWKSKISRYRFRTWLPRFAVADILITIALMWLVYDLTTPKCPICGSRDVSYVLYGKYDWDKDALGSQMRDGRVVIGEEAISRDNARYQCKRCHAKFGERE